MSTMMISVSNTITALQDPQKKDRDTDAFSLMVKEAQDWVENVFGEEVFQEFKIEDDEAAEPEPPHEFENLEKAVVLQEARIFHNDNAVKEDPPACLQILAKLLRLKDDPKSTFSENEATEIFFGTTKLFVCDDEYLRRFVYLFLKEIYMLCDPSDVIMVTSSLTKDMTCDIDIYRANSLRVLSLIINSAMLGAIERYMKQSIIDPSRWVASAGLIAGLRLSTVNSDCAQIVGKWIPEISQAIKIHTGIVQFHALLLMYQMKANDRLAINKIFSQYREKGILKHPLAIVMLIRYACKLMMEEATSSTVRFSEASQVCREGYRFLVSCLKHSSDMVAYEAMRGMCALPLGADELEVVVRPLLSLLKSPQPCDKYAALKVVATISLRFPNLTFRFNEDLGRLLKEANPMISTLAVTTLMRTSTDETLHAVLDHVTSCFQKLDDEFRIMIVQAVLELCVARPDKHDALVSFLSKFIMEKGPYDFKQAIVEGIVQLIKASPEETVDFSLLMLTQSLDVCEHTRLTTFILYTAADTIHMVRNPNQHIPYLYNSYILGFPSVRAAAVSALSKVAAQCPSLRESILVLLERCSMDDDDETRDRATTAVAVLQRALDENPYHTDDADFETDCCIQNPRPTQDDVAAHVFSPLPISFDCLEKRLEAYKENEVEMQSTCPVTFDILPFIEEEENDALYETSLTNNLVDPAQSVYNIPELAALGPIFSSTSPVALTEDETEYVVHCTKHVYFEYVVLQFMIQNTVNGQRLDNVSVAVVARDENGICEAIGEIPASEIYCGETKSCFTVLQRNTETPLESSSFGCELQFTMAVVDETTGEEYGDPYEEEYALEDVDISPSDYMARLTVPDFRQVWDKLAEAHVAKKYGLQMESMQEAVDSVISYLGMSPCDNTSKNITSTSTQESHMLHMSGRHVSGNQVLARAQLMPQDDGIMMLKIAVRSDDKQVAQAVLDCIH